MGYGSGFTNEVMIGDLILWRAKTSAASRVHEPQYREEGGPLCLFVRV